MMVAIWSLADAMPSVASEGNQRVETVPLQQPSVDRTSHVRLAVVTGDASGGSEQYTGRPDRERLRAVDQLQCMLGCRWIGAKALRG